MHILLTDVLTCPRCGPAFGLILLAERVAERRVFEGFLGCSNCREKYAIRDGIVDFGANLEPVADVADAAAAERIAALLGVAQGPAFLLLAGPAVAHAETIAAMLDEVELVTIGGDPARADMPGVNRILAGAPQLPIASSKMTGVALTGAAADLLLDEGARAVSPIGRLMLDPAPSDAAERLLRHGMRIAARQDETVLAVRA